MSYAVVTDMPASWEQYDRIARVLLDPTPPGLIAYAAGPTDEGIRVIGIWEDARSWCRFDAAWQAVADAELGGDLTPTPVRRDLHAEHLVVPRP